MMSLYKAESGADAAGMIFSMDSIAENMEIDPALNQHQHHQHHQKVESIDAKVEQVTNFSCAIAAAEEAVPTPDQSSREQRFGRLWIRDTTSSMSSSSADELELMSDLDSLLLSRARSVSQSLPLHRSSSSSSALGQIPSAISGLGDSVPCTQNAPLDSSTLKVPFLIGDLQRTSSLPNLAGIISDDASTDHSPSNSPSSSSSGTKASQAKATKYSPEERREKLERYRQKRSERNFQKKIKYACRKTLADSRPRVRGRFAKNDEVTHQEQLKPEDHDHTITIRRTNSCTYLAFQY